MPSHCFCEAVREGWIRQPANTVSSLAFIAVAVMVALDTRRRGVTASALMYVTAMLWIGFGSAFYHASLTFAGQFADVFGMYLLGTFVLVHAISRRRTMKVNAIVGLYVLLNAILAVMLLYLPALRRYLFALIILVGLAIELAQKHRVPNTPAARPTLIVPTLILTAAFIIWSLDITHVLCSPTSLLQGHAVWHVLGAVAAAMLYKWVRPSDVVLRQQT